MQTICAFDLLVDVMNCCLIDATYQCLEKLVRSACPNTLITTSDPYHRLLAEFPDLI